MIKKEYCWALLLCFWGSFGAVLGQSGVTFSHLGINDGLSQASVLDILQDEDDLMWFGTREGLNRYDGYRFKVFKSEVRNTTSISHNQVKKIFEDKNHQLWFGTERGLNLFDKKTETFKRFFAKAKNGLLDDNIRDIAEDKDGNLWIGTATEGLFRVVFDNPNAKNRKVKRFEQHALQTAGEGDANSIRMLHLDQNGLFWVATSGGLFELKKFANGTLKIENYNTHNSNIPSNMISGVAADHRGNLWVATWGYGLAKMSWEGKTPVFEHFLPKNTKNSLLEANIITLETDKKGNVWVAGWKEGLTKIEQNKRGEVTFTHFRRDASNPKSIGDNSIRAIFQDKDEVIWVGTYVSGISKIDPSRSKFRHVLEDPLNPKSLAGNDITAIAEDNFGRMWFGEFQGKLNRSLDNTYTNFEIFTKEKFKNLPEGKTVGLLADSKNRFWLGTWGQGIFQVQFSENGTVTGFVEVSVRRNGEEEKSNFKNVRQLYEDRTGNVWLATTKGVYIWRGNAFEHLNLYATLKSGGVTDEFDARTIYEDTRGNLWIGTELNGLMHGRKIEVLNTRDSLALPTYHHYINDLMSVSSESIVVVFEDAKQRLWVGTQGAGLNLFDPETEAFTAFTEADGLPNSVIKAILQDENEHLWISTNGGISKFDPETKKFTNYTIRDGLQSNEFIELSAYRNALNTMFFGGINGFNVFHPEKIITNKRPPKVIFTDFEIFNQPVIFNKKGKIKTPIQFVREITLPHADNVITFEFAALNYTDPASNLYKYRLEGFNKVWQNIGTARRATFTNLAPGTYTLKVKGANSDGIWSETAAELQLTILPPFWQTWWFRTLMGIVIILVVIGIVKFRVEKVERENAKLERIVSERTEEIRQQKRLIEERSRFKEQFFSNVSHELRTPLNGILGISHLLAKTSLNSTQRQFVDAIKTSADNLLVIVNDLLDVSKLNAGQLELIARPFDIIKLLSTLYELFRPRANEKNLNFDFIIDKKLPQYLKGDQVRFYQILINLIGNALKFTAEGGITLRINQTEQTADKHWLLVEVQDSGIGISPEKLTKIFNNYAQVLDSAGYHYEGSGLGLTIVQNLVELHGGTIEVESQVHHGTTFRLKIPLQVASDAEIDEVLREEQQQVFKQKWEGKRVLLLEDNEINQLYAKNLFIDWQLNADYALTVREAEVLSQKTTYDCMLIDVKLPDGDGLKFVEAIRNTPEHPNRKTPAIVLTAGASTQEQARAKNFDIFAYMTKPFEPDTLIRALNQVFMKPEEAQKARLGITEQPEKTTKPTTDYLGTLSGLVKNNRRHLIGMVELYLTQAPEFQQRIDAAIADENYEKLFFETHKMLSSVRTVGIKDLIQAVSELNEATKKLADFEKLAALSANLKAANDLHLPLLQAEIEALKTKIATFSPPKSS